MRSSFLPSRASDMCSTESATGFTSNRSQAIRLALRPSPGRMPPASRSPMPPAIPWTRKDQVSQPVSDLATCSRTAAGTILNYDMSILFTRDTPKSISSPCAVPIHLFSQEIKDTVNPLFPPPPDLPLNFKSRPFPIPPPRAPSSKSAQSAFSITQSALNNKVVKTFTPSTSNKETSVPKFLGDHQSMHAAFDDTDAHAM